MTTGNNLKHVRGTVAALDRMADATDARTEQALNAARYKAMGFRPVPSKRNNWLALGSVAALVLNWLQN